jgi:RsiW-degrading membrane proteinase PrsW (M82 family)
MLLIVIASALLLAVSAFSTEAFAFAIKPGVKQLYEGMLELLKSKSKAAFAMGFVAFSITSPIQIVVMSLVFFLSFRSIILFLIILVVIEEALKALAITIIKPKEKREGVFYGSLVGLAFGLSESILLIPIMDIFIIVRIVPVLIHMLSTGLFGFGYANKNWFVFLLLAILLHLVYNLSLIGYL